MMAFSAPDISIIVRTKNEERWIAHCLGMLAQQDCQDFEVILVDNKSSDYTVQVAKRYPIAAVLTIEEYRPGAAINLGIRAARGQFIACLSAHCIPRDSRWLSTLRRNFDTDKKLAGVYGRQLPVSFTGPLDKRDLLLTFGRDRRVQRKDYFFHNANSMLRRDVWEKFPFDEDVTNIEDRVWGKAVTGAGYRLVYDPDAAVYHHHGLHQSNAVERARGVVSIIEQIDEDVVLDLPDSLRPETAKIAALLPVMGEAKRIAGVNLLKRALSEFDGAGYVDAVYVLADDAQVLKLAEKWGAKAIRRPERLIDRNRSLEEVMQYGLARIEAAGFFPEAVLFSDYLFPFRPPGLADSLIQHAQYNGLDTVFPGYVDYGNYWREVDDRFVQYEDSLAPRSVKRPVYRALYGSGCLASAPNLRTGTLIGGSVGILPVHNVVYTLRYDEETPLVLLESAMRASGGKQVGDAVRT